MLNAKCNLCTGAMFKQWNKSPAVTTVVAIVAVMMSIFVMLAVSFVVGLIVLIAFNFLIRRPKRQLVCCNCGQLCRARFEKCGAVESRMIGI